MNHGLGHLPHEPVHRFSKPFVRFLRIEALAAVVLLLCAAVALATSNSPWSVPYMAFWETPIAIGFGDVEFSRSIKRWINDGAMTLFFFVVALEMKREMVLGNCAIRASRCSRWRRPWAAWWCQPWYSCRWNEANRRAMDGAS